MSSNSWLSSFYSYLQNLCLRKKKFAAFSPYIFKVFQEFLQFLRTLNLILFVNTWGKLHILFLLATITFRFSRKSSLKIFENCLKTSSEEFLFSEFQSFRPKILLNVTLTQGFFSASLQNINYKLTAILKRVKFVSTDINFYWSIHSFTAFINNIFVDGQVTDRLRTDSYIAWRFYRVSRKESNYINEEISCSQWMC